MKISNIQNYHFINYRKIPKKTAVSNPQFRGSDFGVYDFSNEYQYGQYANDFWEKLQQNKEKIYNWLDNCIVNFDDKDGTFSEHLKDMFRAGSEKHIETTFLHKTPRFDEISEEGFDFTKIGTTKYGPGMYFSGSEGELQIYSGKTLQADFKGRFAIGDGLEKYDRLSCQIANETRKCIGMGFEYTPTIMTEYHVLTKFVHQYARNLIVNKLNIDGASCYNNRYFVVFNPNSLSNIRKYP